MLHYPLAAVAFLRIAGYATAKPYYCASSCAIAVCCRLSSTLPPKARAIADSPWQSPRRDTPAAAMPDQLPEEVIEARHAQLLAVINEIAERKNKACEGRVLEILVEGPSHKNAARLEGRTRTNKIVIIEGSERHIGQVMDVKIIRAAPFTLYGDPAILNLN